MDDLDDLLATLGLVLVACGLVALVPMSDHTGFVVAIVLCAVSLVPAAAVLVRTRRRRQR